MSNELNELTLKEPDAVAKFLLKIVEGLKANQTTVFAVLGGGILAWGGFGLVKYNQSKKMFISLLHTAPIFQDHFYTLNLKGNPITNTPYNAEGFYSEVRCGLMHEARTKGNWRINTAPKITDVKNERHFIRATNGNLHIYRTVLHYRLLAYLDSYKAELRQVSPNGIDLRKKFARKMDNLFDFQHDTAFDWWVV